MKSKSTIVIIALVLIVAAAFLIARQSASSDAYETFTLAMDNLVGKGNWSDKGHEISGASALVVNGVTIRLAAAPKPAQVEAAQPAEGQPADGAESKAQTSAASSRTIEIASIEIKKGLSKATMENLLKTQDWRNQKETKIAESIILKGVEHKMPVPGEAEPVNLNIETVTLGSVALAASDDKAPQGRAGYLKALRVEKFAYNNFRASAKNEDAVFDALIAEVNAEGISFGEESFLGLDAIDPSGFSTVMSSMTMKSASIKNMTMNFSDKKEEVKGTMLISSIEEKDAFGAGSIGYLGMNGIGFSLTDKNNFPVEFKLDKVAVNGFDMTAYMKKMTPVFVAAAVDPANAEDLMGEMQTLGDIFVSPFSLKDMSISGLEVKVDNVPLVKLAEASVVGPYVAGQVPAGQKSSLKGFEITLPGDEKAAGGKLKELYEFGRKFGMTNFVVEAEGEGAYDPATGLFSSRTTKFSIKDLVDITANIEFGGLTTDRIEVLKGIPMKTAFVALLNPEAVFGKMSFNKFNLKIVDHGLTDRVMKIAAMEAEGKEDASVEEFKAGVIEIINQQVKTQGALIMENSTALSNSLTSFINKPGSLELNLAADPALSFQSVMSMEGDSNKILNSLNITLSANDEKASAMKFTIPQMR